MHEVITSDCIRDDAAELIRCLGFELSSHTAN